MRRDRDIVTATVRLNVCIATQILVRSNIALGREHPPCNHGLRFKEIRVRFGKKVHTANPVFKGYNSAISIRFDSTLSLHLNREANAFNKLSTFLVSILL